MDKRFLEHTQVEVPLICGPMYPCSNPELVAAVSEAGGMGVIQPASLTYVHGYEFDEGMQKIRSMTSKPLGLNALIESSSKTYFDRVRGWLEAALKYDIKFFITSLGNPKWVVDLVHPHGGVVYHDVTNTKHAEKAMKANVDGLIAVNNRAGGHAGNKTPEELIKELKPFGVPVVCAGGISDETGFKNVLDLGYAAVQMGTRFIATEECNSNEDYKNKIIEAKEKDIVHTSRVTGVPLAVINTPHVQKMGTKAGPIARWMLRGRTTKKWMRIYYFLVSGWKMKNQIKRKTSSRDYLQAGKSVENIHAIEKAGDIVRRMASAVQ